MADNAHTPSGKSSGLAALTVAALGIVYGDIGTSPLYALKEVFAGGHVPLSPANVLGVLSLMFWTITVIVSIKYVSLILRADNHGEGGLIAMLALASNATQERPALRRVLLVVGIFGTALFYGDGVITPAISVLSAVEGLEVITPALKPYIIPVTLLILTVLFAIQRNGTAGIGRFFGPITGLWFAVLAILGVVHIAGNPSVLAALGPTYGWRFIQAQPGVAFVILGALVLCVTGAEALYADMGHFGKRPIRLAWFGLVMPALVLNYFGQGALILREPSAVKNPFYLMAPEWALVPLVVLATAATVIASQALISGAFSVTKQAIQMGYLPRMVIRHTSVAHSGQIYVPFVNWALYVAILFAIIIFGSSSKLAAAYGIAVCTDMLITTIMTFFVIRYGWHYPWALCIAATGFFLVVDVLFFASNLLKLFEGGWFPLALGGFIFTLMMTWKQGRNLLSAKVRADSLPLEVFLGSIFANPPQRVDGTAIFLSSQLGSVPSALLHNLKHNKVLHEHNLFVTVRNHEAPWIGFDKRIEAKSLGHNCWEVQVNFGFKNDPNVPEALRLLKTHGIAADVLDEMSTSYFLSRDIVVPTLGGGMAGWREKLFATLHLNAGAAADYLGLPTNRVVEMGSKVEI